HKPRARLRVAPEATAAGQPPAARNFRDLSVLVGSDLTGREAWLVTNHNGELARAQELGDLLVKAPLGLGWREGIAWHTAITFGDLGCAGGPMATVMVVRAFDRFYAPSRLALIIGLSASGSRSVVRVDACGETYV